jgi:hypothetical protein
MSKATSSSSDDVEMACKATAETEAAAAAPIALHLGFEPGDPDDPHNLPLWRQQIYTVVLGFATLSVTFNSSAYASSVQEIIVFFDISYTVACVTWLIPIRD